MSALLASTLGVLAAKRRVSAPAIVTLLEDTFSGSAGNLHTRAVPTAPQASAWFNSSLAMQLNGSGQVTYAGDGASTNLAEISGNSSNLALPNATAIEIALLVPDAAGGDSFAQLIVESGTAADHKLTINFDRKNGSITNQITVYYQYDGTFGYVEQAYTFGSAVTLYRLEASSGQVELFADGVSKVVVPCVGFAGLMQFDTGAYINVQFRTGVGYTITMDSLKVEGQA